MFYFILLYYVFVCNLIAMCLYNLTAMQVAFWPFCF